MLRASSLGFVTFVFVCGVALAQEFPKPGPEHEKLKELVGEWDAVMTMGDEKSKATATYKSICGGMWLESDFQGSLGPTKFQGRGLDGYDLKRKQYTSVWIDSLETAPLHMTGNYEGKVIVMTGESLGQDGKMEKFKNTTEHTDKDHFTFKMYMVQPDGQDRLAFTIEYTRRK